MLFKKNKRYFSRKHNVHGLEIRGCYSKTVPYGYYVVEDLCSPVTDTFSQRKIVKKGTLRECRDYMKTRFGF